MRVCFFISVAQNELKQLASQQEKEELIRTIEENKQHEMERVEKLRLQNLQYQRDLEGQIDHNARMRSEKVYREEEEYVLGLQAEKEYQTKLKDCLNSAKVETMHPFRRHLMSIQGQKI